MFLHEGGKRRSLTHAAICAAAPTVRYAYFRRTGTSRMELFGAKLTQIEPCRRDLRQNLRQLAISNARSMRVSASFASAINGMPGCAPLKRNIAEIDSRQSRFLMDDYDHVSSRAVRLQFNVRNRHPHFMALTHISPIATLLSAYWKWSAS
jgi:hypothetical protein